MNFKALYCHGLFTFKAKVVCLNGANNTVLQREADWIFFPSAVVFSEDRRVDTPDELLGKTHPNPTNSIGRWILLNLTLMFYTYFWWQSFYKLQKQFDTKPLTPFIEVGCRANTDFQSNSCMQYLRMPIVHIIWHVTNWIRHFLPPQVQHAVSLMLDPKNIIKSSPLISELQVIHRPRFRWSELYQTMKIQTQEFW